MADYSFLKLPTKRLELGDEVHFEVGPLSLKYEVNPGHLYYKGDGDNLTIFHALGIHRRHRDILRKAYGYEPYGGNWPECRRDDCSALTRAVWLLFYEQAKKNMMKDISYLINPNSELKTLRILRDLESIQPILDEVTETFCRVKGYNFRELL